MKIIFICLYRYNDELNFEMIDFIKKSVKGIVLEVFSEVLDGKMNEKKNCKMCKIIYNSVFNIIIVRIFNVMDGIF